MSGEDEFGAQHGAFFFGLFELQPDRGLLLRDRDPVKIGSRAFDLLAILVERAGELVTKDELTAHVWPNIFVHETNLKVTVSNLRRVLGDTGPVPNYIVTIPGRGYRFVAQVVRRSAAFVERMATPPSDELSHLPDIGLIVGREREIAEVANRLIDGRLVSLVGAGGVGKTTVAIAAARRLLDRLPDGFCFVDLSVIQGDHLVAPLVASALGIRGNPIDLPTAIVESIVSRRKLIILDNCEHVLGGVRALASQILGSPTKSRLLATSRERIGVREEALVQIHTLPVPWEAATGPAETILSCPSVELFLMRAREWSDFEFHPVHASAISGICRCLNGLPLALEIVAGQLDRHSPGELLSMLDEHLIAFDNRNPQAPPRQQTLWATLDWSYGLLSGDEAEIFRFLCIFAGSFDLESVLAVLGPLGLDAYRVTVGLGGLVAKSLVVAEADDIALSYRLLNTARLYAAEQSRHDRWLGLVWENYACHLVSLFARSEEEWLWRETTEWRNRYKVRANDLRQALDWCFGRGERPDLGFRLTTSALTLWEELSSVAEARSRIEQALAYAVTSECDLKSVARLMSARAWSLLNVKPIPPESVQVWESAVAYARGSGQVELHLRALWGSAVCLSKTGHCDKAIDFLQRFRDLAVLNKEWAAIPDGEWLQASIEIYRGQLVGARRKLELLARENPLVGNRARVTRFAVDRSMMLRTHLSIALWLTGAPTRAQRVADEVSEFDEDSQHLVSQICHVVWARLPMALWNSDLPAFAAYTTKLRSYLEIENIQVWHPVLHFHQAIIDFHRGNKAAIEAMRYAIDDIIASNLIVRIPLYLGILAEALLQEERLDEARSTLGEASAFATRNNEAWSDPELRRTAAGICLARGDRLAAITTLEQAKSAALDSGALYFALRAANDLAEIHLTDGRVRSAIDALAAVHVAYSEGSDTQDLVRAARLLERAGTALGAGQ